MLCLQVNVSGVWPCGTLWPSVCFVQKLPVGSWLLSDASPPPAARTVCTQMIHLSRFGFKTAKNIHECKRLKDKMSPLSSLVHLRDIKSSLLWCADLYLVHLLQSGIFYWGNKEHFLQEEILFFVSCDHFLQDKMFLSRHFTQDFSLMGEKQKIVSPHMIKNIVCWKIQNTKYFSRKKLIKNTFSGGNFCWEWAFLNVLGKK